MTEKKQGRKAKQPLPEDSAKQESTVRLFNKEVKRSDLFKFLGLIGFFVLCIIVVVALAVIEPKNALYIDASTEQAYDDADNRYIHAGESLHLKMGNTKGTGVVTGVSGKKYTVEILTGDYDVNDTVRCFRESTAPSDSEVGRGKVTRYADVQVLADSGRIAAVHVKPGDTVEVGDLLFELVDAQSAKNASRSVAADASGVITLMNTVSGAQVYRGQLLCEVADMSALELSAEVDELDLNSVAVGDTLTYTLDAFDFFFFVWSFT